MRILGAIDDVETIAKGRGIREYAQLVVRYGGKNWMKRKGTATVELDGQSLALKCIGTNVMASVKSK